MFISVFTKSRHKTTQSVPSGTDLSVYETVRVPPVPGSCALVLPPKLLKIIHTTHFTAIIKHRLGPAITVIIIINVVILSSSSLNVQNLYWNVGKMKVFIIFRRFHN